MLVSALNIYNMVMIMVPSVSFCHEDHFDMCYISVGQLELVKLNY